MTRTMSFVAGIGALVCADVASAAVVTNGDFSAGLTGWAWQADPDAEPFMSATVVAGPLGGGPAFRVNPGNAGNAQERGGTLSQVLSLTAGVNYTVAGILGIENVGGGPNADGGTITISVGGNALHVFDVTNINGLTLITSPFSEPFTPAVTGGYLLEVRFTRGFQNFVPNIYHWADTLSVVPAPGAFGLLALGVFAARRRPRA